MKISGISRTPKLGEIGGESRLSAKQKSQILFLRNSGRLPVMSANFSKKGEGAILLHVDFKLQTGLFHIKL